MKSVLTLHTANLLGYQHPADNEELPRLDAVEETLPSALAHVDFLLVRVEERLVLHRDDEIGVILILVDLHECSLCIFISVLGYEPSRGLRDDELGDKEDESPE